MSVLRIVTYVGADHFTGKNWCAKCGRCGIALTKYAFTEAEAKSEAMSVAHRCP